MKRIVLGALIGLMLVGTANAAPAAKKDALGVPGGIIGTQSTASASQSGDILAQLRAKFTADVTSDLNSALALAQQVPAGCAASPPTVTACGPADSTAVPCYQALISLNGVINSYTPPVDKPHVISDLEQLRIVARTVQSTNFKDACAPLVQDIQSQANQLVASVLGIVSGAAKIGLAVP